MHNYDISKLKGVFKSPMGDFLDPELAVLANEFPKSGHWIYEIKYDGYRLLTFIKNKTPILKTRNNQNWSNKFPEIINALKVLNLDNVIFDGELVAVDKNGVSNFQLLQNTFQENKAIDLIYYIFDILYLDKYNLTNLPLFIRKQILKSCFTDLSIDNKLIRYSDDLQGGIKFMFKKLCKSGYEGVIAKNANSCYSSFRSKNWLKIKCINKQEFVIGGYTKPNGLRMNFGALLLGYFDKARNLIYCGKVGTGFNKDSLQIIFFYLMKNHSDICPFSNTPYLTNVHWVKPKFVAEIKFNEWTKIGYLRQPVFEGLRFDKAAETIRKI